MVWFMPEVYGFRMNLIIISEKNILVRDPPWNNIAKVAVISEPSVTLGRWIGPINTSPETLVVHDSGSYIPGIPSD